MRDLASTFVFEGNQSPFKRKRYETSKIGRLGGENTLFLCCCGVGGGRGDILNLFTCVDCRKQLSQDKTYHKNILFDSFWWAVQHDILSFTKMAGYVRLQKVKGPADRRDLMDCEAQVYTNGVGWTSFACRIVVNTGMSQPRKGRCQEMEPPMAISYTSNLLATFP
jgi:hypothetical protein